MTFGKILKLPILHLSNLKLVAYGSKSNAQILFNTLNCSKIRGYNLAGTVIQVLPLSKIA